VSPRRETFLAGGESYAQAFRLHECVPDAADGRVRRMEYLSMVGLGRIPVFCATTEGHTHRIASEIAATLRQQGFDSEVQCLATPMPAVDWTNVRGAIVGASIHAGRHQQAALDFATREVGELAARPSAFFSVSLAAASKNPAEVDAVRALATGFVRQAGWQPTRIFPVAGKLAYTKYGFVTRQVMRCIAWREGAPTDTSRDYEFTDWNAVRQFALDFAADVVKQARPPAALPAAV
jgi:menaquinone-dependent protoporphyrinogen oxidase